MPSRRPVPDMPEGARRAYAGVSNVSRLSILKFLVANHDVTQAEIVEGTDVSHPSTRVALDALKDLGYVVQDSTVAYRGRKIRYSLDRERYATDMAELFGWTLS